MNQFNPKKSQFTGIRWLARHILLASILVLAGINVAQAVPNTWYLDGWQFNTSTTANGSFVYDADTNTYSNININVTKNGNTNTYVVINPGTGNNGFEMNVLEQLLPDQTGQPHLKLRFNSHLTNAGGSIDIIASGSTSGSYQSFCGNAGCNPWFGGFDFATAGRVTTSLFPPSITSSATASVAENQTSAIDVQATDNFDTEGAGLTFIIRGGADQALFNIDANTGVVTFIVAPDAENPVDSGGDNNYNIQVTITDSTGLSATQNIVITVTDVADTTPPTANPVLNPSSNTAGWNNSDVTINWNWSDELGGSGIDTNNCTTSTLLDTDGSFGNIAGIRYKF